MFMVRYAKDDSEALTTADAMEIAGATVVQFMAPRATASANDPAGASWVVFAKVRDDAHCDEVDREIDKRLGDEEHDGVPGR